MLSHQALSKLSVSAFLLFHITCPISAAPYHVPLAAPVAASLAMMPGGSFNQTQQALSGPDALAEAAYKGDIAAIKRLLAKGVSPNAPAGRPSDISERDDRIESYKTEYEQTALIHALRGKRYDAAKYLISRGAKVNARNARGRTALLDAVMRKDLAGLNFLLARGADIKLIDNNGSGALYEAALSGDIAIFERLLARGLSLRTTYSIGPVEYPEGSNFPNVTVLQAGLRGGYPKMVRHLLKRGVARGDFAKYGPMALVEAARFGNLPMVELLLANKVDPDTIAPDFNGVLNAVENFPASESSPIGEALRTRKFEVVKYLLTHGVPLNPAEGSGPIFLANDLESLELLLGLGADVNVLDREGYSLLYSAVTWDRDSLALALLAKGADPNRKGDKADVPLNDAIKHKKTALIRALLAKGADARIPNREGKSGLTLAYLNQDLPLLEELLSSLKPAERSIEQQALLMMAMKHNDSEMITKLLDAGVDTTQADENGITMLMWATNTSPELVELFLKKGGDVNQRDKDGQTAMMFAARSGQVKIFESLLAAGGKLDETTSKGRTLLLTAAEWFNPELVDYLLDKGLDINARDAQGRTALMLVTDSSYKVPDPGDEIRRPIKAQSQPKKPAFTRESFLKHLLDRGADPNLQDLQGRTVLHYAGLHLEPMGTGSCENPPFLTNFWAEQDVDVNTRDKDGRTALMSYVLAYDLEPMKRLLARGADPNLQDKDGNYALLNLNTALCEQMDYKGPVHVEYKYMDGFLYSEKEALLLANGADPTLKNKAGQSAARPVVR